MCGQEKSQHHNGPPEPLPRPFKTNPTIQKLYLPFIKYRITNFDPVVIPTMPGVHFAYGAQDTYISWAACLQPPRPAAPLRRFDRVACLSSERAGRRTHKKYMKRVADFTLYRPSAAFLINDAFKLAVDVNPVEMEGSRRAHTKRPRLPEHDSIVQQDAPWTAQGTPSSEQIRNEYSQAATMVAAAIARDTTAIDVYDLALARQGRFVRPVISTKRQSSGLPIAQRGARLIERKSMLPDVKMSSMEGEEGAPPLGQIEENTNLGPMPTSAAELSMIAEAGEPDDDIPTPVIPPPRSPHKRKACLEAYDITQKRPNANENKLLLSSAEDGQQAAEASVTNPPRIFKVPSESDFTDSDEDEEETDAKSPIRRPVGPTPSKWRRDKPPSTPARCTRHSIGFAATPFKIDEELSLLDAVSPCTPKFCPVPKSYDLTPTSFNFGGVSPIGTHRSVAGTPPVNKTHSASKSWVKAFWSGKTRRRSEPLLNRNIRLPTLEQDQLQRESPSAAAAADETAVSTPRSKTMQQSEAATPISSYHAVSSFLRKTPACQKKREIYIDTRKNLDIFGAQTSPVKQSLDMDAASSVVPDNTEHQPNAIEGLAEMARGACDGLANVIVYRENGRLVVRFKISPEHAALFSDSQGCDDSRIAFSSVAGAMPEEGRGAPAESEHGHVFYEREASLLFSNKSSAQGTKIQQLDAASDEFQQMENKESPLNSKLSMAKSESASPQPSPSPVQWDQAETIEGHTLIVDGFDAPDAACETPTQCRRGSANMDMLKPSPVAVYTPEQSGLNQDTPSSAVISELNFEIEFATPTQELGISAEAQTTEFDTPPCFAKGTPAPKSALERNSSPTSTNSFTPVNSSPIIEESVKVEDKYKNYEQAAHNANRDYLSAFINTHRSKSRPKGRSTTTAESPIASSAARAPLGDRSPNAKSPSPVKSKNKRRLHDEENLSENTKELGEPSPKKIRRGIQAKKPSVAATPGSSSVVLEDTEVISTVKTDGLVDVKTDDGSIMRRSSRLTAKTSIPTAIKINNRSGITALSRPAANIIRSEQVDLTRQTTANTRRNRSGAGSVEQTLMRCSEELSSDDQGSSQLGSEPETSRVKGGKAVAWKDPLESYQEEEKPRRGRPLSKGKLPLAKVGISGAAAKSQLTAPKAMPTKLAKSLGMVANGTPAKRRPATRASSRSD